MQQGGCQPRLIGNRRTATIALVLTGWVTALSVRAAFSQGQHHSYWLLPLSPLLPTWALWTANGLLYAYLLWLCIVFLRAFPGKERILIAGWVPGILLGPIEGRVSAPAAAVMQYVEAISIAVAFVAALLILLQSLAKSPIGDRRSGISDGLE